MKSLPIKFGLGEMFPYKVALNETGYNYYVMEHCTGFVLVIKEKTDGTAYLYGNGGTNAATAYANRAILDYKTISALLAD